jgi:DNA (cytosine-5)-methyltransferase 1
MNDISSKANEPTHLDLFSGIGGFALAAKWAGFKTIGFCDNEPYAQAVLKKHWPDVPIHRDIKTLDGTAYRGVTLLTGGFPCQPFSCAGKQRGKDDDRYLWPQMLRVIQEARPAWIIGENVAGIINLGLEKVCSDLEGIGYEVQSIVIPACAIGAQHRRDRVWIIANTNSIRQNLWQETIDKKKKQRIQDIIERCSFREILDKWEGWKSTPYICRSNDGVSNRVDRLKGLGNAIVPQVAYQILKTIKSL